MPWLNALILFALFAGHCELMTAWVNRLHGLPWPRRRLRRMRLIHDAAIFAFVPLVLWRIGFAGPRLLTGGSWAALPLGWAIYFVLCGIGCVSLSLCALRHLTRRRPEVVRTRTLDVAHELGQVPAGPGLRGRIARLPFNEVFRLEVNEKHLTLPSLPRELDGLSIVQLTDTHFRGPVGRTFFEYACERAAGFDADLAVFTGDLIDEPACLDWLSATLGRLDAPLGRWFILGNHDWLTGAEPIRLALANLGWSDLGGRTAVVLHAGRRIALGGDETPWLNAAPDFVAAGRVDLRLLLSHTPDNFPQAAARGIDLTLSGHNHGGQVCLPVVGPVYSPSLYGVRYAAGVFRSGGSLLHVGRGLSAERPLRWNCPPELTKLVLRAPP